MPKNFTKTKGFTMIELLVSIVVIAVISTVGFVSYSNSQKISRDFRRKQDLRAVQTALELYFQKNAGAYPIGSAWTNVNVLKPDFINNIPQDPTDDTTHKYNYSSTDGKTYLLCANLENDSDTKDRTAPPNSCTAAGFTDYDFIKSPTD